jgi:hypothetical protein
VPHRLGPCRRHWPAVAARAELYAEGFHVIRELAAIGQCFVPDRMGRGPRTIYGLIHRKLKN